MDVVYTFAYNPRSKSKQLIYSLRSIEKHLKGFDKVYIIGANPGLQGIIYIPATDLLSPAMNIKDKLELACMCPEISEDFFYIADDHYLTQDVEVKDYPTYSCGTLFDLAKTQKTSYKQYVENTARILGGGRNFNIHSPIIYNKTKLMEAISRFEWKQLGYLLKSIYGNVHDLPSVEIHDTKISRQMPIEEMRAKIAGRPVFSTGHEYQAKNIGLLLQELYPNKSRFEI